MVSDIHMGYKETKLTELCDFLGSVTCDTLILNGDILDMWQLRKTGRKRWSPRYTDCLKVLMDKMEKESSKIIYVVGNHDDFLHHVIPFEAFNISFVYNYIHECGDGRFFVTHGHIFDNISMNRVWLAKLGDFGFRLLLASNSIVNKVLYLFGFRPRSYAQNIKLKVKDRVARANRMDQMVVGLAHSHGCKGVICGHIHKPEDRMIEDVRYLNSGDWIHSMSALLEDEDGNWSVYRYGESK